MRSRWKSFPTEHEAFGRARELLKDGDHSAVSVRDSSEQHAVRRAPAAEVGVFRRIEGRPRREVQPRWVPV